MDGDRGMIIVSKKAAKKQASYMDLGYVPIDLTSNSPDPDMRRFSPFYSHLHEGGFPLDDFFELSLTSPAASVEGVWQGLKMFENEGIDLSKFWVTDMKNMKRSARAAGRGPVLGHWFRDGLIGYREAREKIYLPLYRRKLLFLEDEVRALVARVDKGDKLMFLDYTTNSDIDDTSKPLSHASVLRDHIIDQLDSIRREGV